MECTICGEGGIISAVAYAVITRCNRLESKKYSDGLADIAIELAMKYFVVVNFACLPADEFAEKKSWYAFFQNIDREGGLLWYKSANNRAFYAIIFGLGAKGLYNSGRRKYRIKQLERKIGKG